jgi:hypothetical protein
MDLEGKRPNAGSAPSDGPSAGGVPGRRDRVAASYPSLARALRPDGDGDGPTIHDAATAAVDGKGGGRPVDGAVAAQVGAHLGADFGAVRVHDDPLAQEATAAMGARAFAYGGDVFLGAGESDGDLGLMAHELTHVAQQGAAGQRLPQRRVEVGAADSPAEREADAVAGAVTAGAPPAGLLVDDGPVAAGQMLKSTFIAQLRAEVTAAADAELGPMYSAIGCPYIDQYFRRYADRPAADGEALLKRFAPATRGARAASDLIPAVVARVRQGVQHWRATGGMPPDLVGLEEGGPAAAATTTPATGAHAKAALGDGAALDARLAGAVGDAYGTSVDHVRVHTGDAAAQLARAHDAPAVAFGSDLAFAPGAYNPGTPEGDAMIAHELAHVVQQRDADPHAQLARKDDTAAEGDANRAAGGLLARLWGGRDRSAAIDRPSVRADLSLQRCTPASWVETPGIGARHGVGIVLTPTPSTEHPAIVGSSPQLALTDGALARSVMVYRWEAVDPLGRLTLSAPGETQRVLIGAAGNWTVRAKIGHLENNTIEWEWIETTFPAVTAANRATAVLAGTTDESLASHRAMQDLGLALVAPVNDTSAATRVRGTAPNPQTVSDPGGIMMFELVRPDAAPADETKHWYAAPLSWDGMPAQLDGHARTTINGVEMFDLGTTDVAQFRARYANTYAITCHVLRGGQKVAEHNYTQSVQSQQTIDAARRLRDELAVVDAATAEFETTTSDGRTRPLAAPVTAIHVNATTGAETRLHLYLGRKAADTSRYLLVHATAGLDPSHETLRFEGGSVDDVLGQFGDRNHLPTGDVALRVAGGVVPGVAASTRTIHTTGNSSLGTAAGLLGGLALVLGVAAIPFTGGGSMVATALIIGSGVAGAAAGTLSLIDHLQNSRLDTLAISIDVVSIAASFLNTRAAFMAMREGPVVLTATRQGQFLLWSAFTTDVISGVLVSVDGARQISQIMDSGLSGEDKTRAIASVVANLILTGGLLVLSVRQMTQMAEKVRTGVGPDVEGQLTNSTRMTLSHFDADTLRALRGADAPQLERLVAMMRDDPAALTRLIQRRAHLLGALQRTTGHSIVELEAELVRARMTGDLGLAPEPAGRIATALRESGLSGAALHGLDDATLRRLHTIDEHIAANRMPEAMREMDGLAGIAPAHRQTIESALARAHGRPDPHFARDPRAALRAKWPDRPETFWTRLAGLDDDALRALERASAAQLDGVARVCDLSPAGASVLLKKVGLDFLPHRIEAGAGGQLRINGQLEIHPSRLDQIAAEDLRVIMAATATSPPDQARLAPFTRSGSYRLRFQYQLDGNVAWFDELTNRPAVAGRPGFDGLTPPTTDPRVSTRDRLRRALANDRAAQVRLTEATNSEIPGGVRTEVQNRAAGYALDRNPSNVAEFVNHFEMWVSEYNRQRRDLRRLVEARLPALQAGPPPRSVDEARREAFRELAGRDMGAGWAAIDRIVLDGSPSGVPRPFAALTDSAVTARAAGHSTDLGGAIGPRTMATPPTLATVVTDVRALPPLQFRTESSATYHVNKHYNQLPSAHRDPAYAPTEAGRYLRSAQETVARGTPTANFDQDGSFTVSFRHNFGSGSRDMVAIVRVTPDGQAVIATYGN